MTIRLRLAGREFTQPSLALSLGEALWLNLYIYLC